MHVELQLKDLRTALNAQSKRTIALQAQLDHLVVLDADGVVAVDAAAVSGEPSPWPLDPLTLVSRVAALPEGERVGGPDLARDWALHGAARAFPLERKRQAQRGASQAFLMCQSMERERGARR